MSDVGCLSTDSKQSAFQSEKGKNAGPPLWLLAELTYRCPLQCPYCSNPVNFAAIKEELTTEEWKRVFAQGREMGAAQLGFSGGEPLLRQDLEELVSEARSLGYYTNLITSGIGLTPSRMAALKEAGLDHIQISFQDSDEERNNALAGSRKAFDAKLKVAQAIKEQGYPMVMNVVLHRHNIDHLQSILNLSFSLGADYLELANSQYYGWALHNRDALMPDREQLQRAELVTNRFREEIGEQMKIYFVVPDYYESRPKACMNGWGAVFLTVAPDGLALPCHNARDLPFSFPNVRDHSLDHIWYQSEGFRLYRGDDWMKEPCRSCSEKDKDFGGCRCQAFLLTGDARNADPVCGKSEHHHIVVNARREADHQDDVRPLVFRNTRNSVSLT